MFGIAITASLVSLGRRVEAESLVWGAQPHELPRTDDPRGTHSRLDLNEHGAYVGHRPDVQTVANFVAYAELHFAALQGFPCLLSRVHQQTATAGSSTPLNTVPNTAAADSSTMHS